MEQIIANILIGLLILVLVVRAIRYLLRAKKEKRVCLGCPSAGCCSGTCGGTGKEEKEGKK